MYILLFCISFIAKATSSSLQEDHKVYSLNSSHFPQWDYDSTLSQRNLQIATSDIQVNQFITGNQQNSAVASLKDGGFVIVWESAQQINSGIEVMARLYLPNGVAISNEFIVNTITVGDQQNPSVVGTQDGGFAVVWESNDGVSGTGFDIFCRLFYRNGTAKAAEFMVNDVLGNDQKEAYIASHANGNLVFTWSTNDPSATGIDVKAKLFDPTGVAVGTEFLVNTYPTSDQIPGGVCALTYGGFVIIWQSSGQVNGLDVYGQMYNDDLTTNGGEFLVNNVITTNDQGLPSVACLNDGGFVAVWHSHGASNPKDIMGRVFNSDGSERRGETIINSVTTNTQENPAVAPLDQGGFVVAWESNNQDGNNLGVFTRWFDSNGFALQGTDVQMNIYYQGLQQNPSIAAVDAGFVIAWESNNQDTNGFGVYFGRYTSHLAQLCSSDNDCLGTNFTKCLTTDRICVKCLDNTPCGGSQCSQFYHRCYSCLSDAGCPSMAPYCLQPSGVCHQCPMGICPLCSSGQYQYDNHCYSTCPPGTFNLTGQTTLKCDTCITNNNPAGCVPCSTDQDCNHLPFGQVFCISNKCTTIDVQFLNPAQVIESDASNEVKVAVLADSTYHLTFTIEPNYIPFQITSSGIIVGPWGGTQDLPSKIKIIVYATSAYGETVSDTVLLTVDQPQQYTIAQKAAAAAVAGAMFISGVDPALLWSLANLMQLFYYLLFLNVNYPKNLRRFLGLFSLGRLNFMPNPLSGVIQEVENESLPSPPRFYENSFTGLFVETSGSILSMMLMSLGIDLSAHWSGFLRLWLSSYLELMLATLLQIYVLNAKTLFYFSSSFLAVLIFLGNLILPIGCLIILKKINKTRENIGKFRALTEDYDLNHTVKRNFTVFAMLRRMFQGLFIVLLYHIPLLQVTSVWLVIFVHLTLLLVYMPHHKQSLNFLDIIIEMSFVIIHSLIIPIGYSDITGFMSQQTKEIIGCCFFVLAIQFVLILKEQYEAICNLLKKTREFLRYLKNRNKIEAKDKPKPEDINMKEIFQKKKKVQRAGRIKLPVNIR